MERNSKDKIQCIKGGQMPREVNSKAEEQEPNALDRNKYLYLQNLYVI